MWNIEVAKMSTRVHDELSERSTVDNVDRLRNISVNVEVKTGSSRTWSSTTTHRTSFRLNSSSEKGSESGSKVDVDSRPVSPVTILSQPFNFSASTTARYVGSWYFLR